MQDTEKFYPIKGFENNYEVNRLGEVRSIDRLKRVRGNGLAINKGKSLKPLKNNKGYFFVNLYDGSNNLKKMLIHRIVAINFIENYDLTKTEINHKDGDKSNNKVENLEWSNRHLNNLHRYSELKYKCKHRKLTEEDVLYIKENCKKGCLFLGVIALAKKYGVSKTVISRLINNKSYKNLNLKT